MIKKYNDVSLAVGVPGLILMILGSAIEEMPLAQIGYVLFALGLGFYAKAKGRSLAWCLVFFLPFMLLVVLLIARSIIGLQIIPLIPVIEGAFVLGVLLPPVGLFVFARMKDLGKETVPHGE